MKEGNDRQSHNRIIKGVSFIVINFARKYVF